MLPQAREWAHPSVMNETRSTFPLSTSTQNSMVSPQGPVMRAWPLKDFKGPLFRGAFA
jgi:hypothetical protein